MKIYIVFGDERRSDGENIKAIYADKDRAEQFLLKYGYSHIEEFEIYDKEG